VDSPSVGQEKGYNCNLKVAIVQAKHNCNLFYNCNFNVTIVVTKVTIVKKLTIVTLKLQLWTSYKFNLQF